MEYLTTLTGQELFFGSCAIGFIIGTIIFGARWRYEWFLNERELQPKNEWFNCKTEKDDSSVTPSLVLWFFYSCGIALWQILLVCAIIYYTCKLLFALLSLPIDAIARRHAKDYTIQKQLAEDCEKAAIELGQKDELSTDDNDNVGQIKDMY